MEKENKEKEEEKEKKKNNVLKYVGLGFGLAVTAVIGITVGVLSKKNSKLKKENSQLKTENDVLRGVNRNQADTIKGYRAENSRLIYGLGKKSTGTKIGG